MSISSSANHIHNSHFEAAKITRKYSPVVRALKALKKACVLDGEMVVFDEEGRPNFNAMQLYNG